MPQELLIGIAGRKGVGKNTVADMLVEMIPDVTIMAWADVLKDEVAVMVTAKTGIRPSREEMEGLKAEIYGPLFQGWGAYRRHYFGDNYWIGAWERRALARVIVPDCRHHNEVQYIKDHGGVLLYVDGPSRWQGDTRSSTHESERYVEELRERADYTIVNAVSLGTLREIVAYLAEDILTAVGFRAGSLA